MNRRKWLWAALLALPAAVIGGGLAFAKSKAGAFTCPLTGEQLPCEKCCPLNDNKQGQDGPYVCPVTGEELPCEGCCPLDQAK